MKLKGGAGNDTLRGGNAADVLQGLGGRDVLLGNGGKDLLDGGKGDDDLRGGAGDDIYIVDNVNDITKSIRDPGRDEVRASVSYVLGAQQEDLRLTGSANLSGTGNALANKLTGNAGRNLLNGGNGNDTLNGGKGDDDLRGGGGNDTYIVDHIGDVNKRLADAGTDTLVSSISYTLGASQENLTLAGTAALTAGGNAFANVITGNGGSNLIDGGAGADTLNGGLGNDVLVFDSADVLVNGGLGSDRLLVNGANVTLNLVASTVFKSIETIDLTGSGNNSLNLDAAAVLALASDSHTLRVIGNAGDKVHVGDTWQATGQLLVEGKTFVEYTKGDVTLQLAGALSETINVSTLNVAALTGVGGVRYLGSAAANVGSDVTGLGDFNGDGLSDFLIRGHQASDLVGTGFVVFGASAPAAEIPLAALDGSTGARVAGILDPIFTKNPVGLGDFDGDGLSDVLFNTVIDGTDWGGQGVVVFGHGGGLSSSFTPSQLPATEALHLSDSVSLPGSVRTVGAAGDVNGDGFADLLLARTRIPGGAAEIEGATDVVFGGPRGTQAEFDVAGLNGSNGFRLRTNDPAQPAPAFYARAVSTAGDLNGDGFSDIVVSGSHSGQGTAYVALGAAGGIPAVLDTSDLDGTNGFSIFGDNLHDGVIVSSAGDFNGDGFDDLILGGPFTLNAGGGSFEGAYVIFGTDQGFAANLDLATLDGHNGFRIDGVTPGEFAGAVATGVGDVNGDGYDDVLISSPAADVNGLQEAGSVSILFGAAGGFDPVFGLGSIDGHNGLRIDGGAAFSHFGGSASDVGDTNGDGYDDVLIGVPGATVDGHGGAGVGYLFLGDNFTEAVTNPGSNANDTLVGTAAAESLLGGLGDDTLDGAAAADVLRGGAGNDALVFDNADRVVDGGSGYDRLVLTGESQAVDFTAHGQGQISNIEAIDLRGTGDNSLRLTLRDLFNLSDTSNSLDVRGNVGDSVAAGGGWYQADNQTIDGVEYGHYVQAATRLAVGDDPENYLARSAHLRLDTGMEQSLIQIGVLREGGAGGALLEGGNGNDILLSGTGIDTLIGDGGDDAYVVSQAEDVVVEEVDAGEDTIASHASYTLPDNVEVLRLLGNDDLDATGNDGINTLLGNGGSNLLTGGAGADILQGGGGNDRLVLDLDDAHVDGGAGEDTLVVSGANLAIDLTSATAFQHIEVLDLHGTGPNTLTLDAATAGAISSDTHVLRVLGGDDDHFNGSGVWQAVGQVNHAGVDFLQYHSGDVTLEVQTNLSSTIQVSALSLGALDGLLGFSLSGAGAGVGLQGPRSGAAVSAVGDFNGDGFDDFVIGASSADDGARQYTGSAYLVFGHSSDFAPDQALAALDGSNGFRLIGANSLDYAGYAVSGGGDINGDGYADLVIGAPQADVNLGSHSGQSFVVFGHVDGDANPATLDLAALDGTNGFRLDGPADVMGHSGISVSIAGDINGDGYDDLIIGADRASPDGPNGVPPTATGLGYVVFGHADGFASVTTLADLNGVDGFRISGAASDDSLGFAVSGAGDLNGDGLDDLTIGAFRADPAGVALAGSSYVIFGRDTGFAAELDVTTLDGSTGLRLDGATENELSGRSLSNAGDINGDGYSDLIIGAFGASYVVFGTGGGFNSSLDLAALNGYSGFRIAGEPDNGFSGKSVSAAGDFNGDGYNDLLITAPGADSGSTTPGSSYVLFGHAGAFAATLDLATIDGQTGLRLDGIAVGDNAGHDASAAGDVNGDGFDDILIGAPQVDADPVNAIDSGQSYVVFGGMVDTQVDFRGGSGNELLTGTAAAEILIGGQGDDTLEGGAGSDVLRAGAGTDTLVFDLDDRRVDGGSGVDTLRFDGAGESLDLTAVSNLRYTGIERIDLTGSGDNNLTLDLRDVLALPDHNNVFLPDGTTQLLVDGDAGDVVTSLNQGWTAGQNVNLGDNLYTSYTHTGSTAMLLLDSEMTHNIS